MTAWWLSDDSGMTLGWLWDDYGMTHGWLSDDSLMIDLIFFCSHILQETNESKKWRHIIVLIRGKQEFAGKKKCASTYKKDKSMQYSILFNLNRPVNVQIVDILYKFPRFKYKSHETYGDFCPL